MRAIPSPLTSLTAVLLLAALAAPPLAQPRSTGAEDSLRTRPRLGGGSTIDRSVAAEPAAREEAATWRPTLAFSQLRLQEVLAQHLLPEDENASRVSLFVADSLLAVDLYQLRGAEAPQLHPVSDLWIYVWRGRGRCLRERSASAYGPGELLQIPAGTAYALENESGAPTVALVWQWPPIDESLTRRLPPTEEGATPLWEALRAGGGGFDLVPSEPR